MENGTERYIETVKYLEKLYDYINGRLFGGELEKPVITVQRDERNKAFGWYSTEKVWKERGENEGAHELNITAQYLIVPYLKSQKRSFTKCVTIMLVKITFKIARAAERIITNSFCALPKCTA